MDKQDLIALVARIARSKPADIADHLSLASVGISKSLGLAALRSHVEAAVGAHLNSISVDMTIAELTRLAAGDNAVVPASLGLPNPAPPPASAPVAPPPQFTAAPAEIVIGLDLQDVASLPTADDLRTDPFYSANFAPSELATALLRPDPRSHLCGVFSAKEAVKKSHPALLNLRMNALIVDHDVSGRPSLRFADPALQARFNCSLSITHSAGFAASTCLTIAV